MKIQQERLLEVLEPALIAYQLSGYYITHSEMWNRHYFAFIDTDSTNHAVEICLINNKFNICAYCRGIMVYESSCKCYEELPKRFVNAMKKLGF